MKKPKSVALVAAGQVSNSPIARFWLLSKMLGPVKASSFRLASRIANTLRAGYPVRDYGAFDACSLILVCVPDDAIIAVVQELASAGLYWPDKSVVLYSASRGSGDLKKLAARGASIGSVAAVPGFQDSQYLLEGDKTAIQETAAVLESRDRRYIAIERDLKPLYLAALTCTSSLLHPLLMAASESLRIAGLTPSESIAILEKQFSQGLRAHVRGGRRAYSPPTALAEQLKALSSANPALAHFVAESCRLAERVLNGAVCVIPQTATRKIAISATVARSAGSDVHAVAGTAR